MIGYMSPMHTTLRKMGNSVGMIVPAALLKELGATAGTTMDVRVEAGTVLATPTRRIREGWEEGAAAVAAAGEDPDEAAWCAFGNAGDDDLVW